MKQRCENPKNTSYYHYGNRGIGFEPSWGSFEHFLNDMGERPIGMTLDRINPELGYSKDNCRWTTPKEQANNRLNNIKVLLDSNILTPLELKVFWNKSLPATYNRIYKFFKFNPKLGYHEQIKPIVSRNRKAYGYQ